MVWIYLVLASLFEVMWATSLKFLNFKKIKISWRLYGWRRSVFWIALFPLCTYVVFGLCNVSLFTMATKFIPLTIAYAVWMGLSMCIQTMVDMFWFKEKFNLKQLLFLALILIGVVGIKLFHKVG